MAGRTLPPSPRRLSPVTLGAPPLAVRDLKTYFYQDDGLVKAVDGASFDVFPGKTLGIVGERAAAKCYTRSIMRIVDRRRSHRRRTDPAAAGGECQRHGRPRSPTQGRWTRDARDRRRRDGLIFQEPMTSFSPVHTVGEQIDRGDPAAPAN